MSSDAPDGPVHVRLVFHPSRLTPMVEMWWEGTDCDGAPYFPYMNMNPFDAEINWAQVTDHPYERLRKDGS